MAGKDKGLVMLAGRPMVSHVLERLSPQVDNIVINANRNIPQYERFGVSVIRDSQDSFWGPLAGVAVALANIKTPLLLTVPCDGPRVPLDLAARLYYSLLQANAAVAVVHDGQRLHPVFALLRRELRPSLENFLTTGGRKIEQWFHSLRYVKVNYSDSADNFININDDHELIRLERCLQLGASVPELT